MIEGSLRERRQRLLDQAGLQGVEFCRAYAEAADDWLSEIARRASGDTTRKLALLAVGGYGRRDLCPYSDLDVVLVHDGLRDVASVADAMWYPIWDEGVHLDHSVRKPAEMLEAATDDLRVALGLLNARVVWGDPRVGEPLIQRIAELWRRRIGARWLPVLARQMDERRAVNGDVAFLLEPELKEGHGGLLDINVLRAVASYAPLLADYVDVGSLAGPATMLTAIRVELHRSAGRELDRLLLQEQDHIAAVLGYPDADALMAAVAEAGRAVAWVSSDTWHRRRFWEPTPVGSRRLLGRRAPKPANPSAPVAEPQAVEPGIVEVEGEVALTPAAPLTSDSSIALRLAAVSAEREIPIARGALHRLGDKLAPPPDPWPAETRQALVRLLAAGHRAIDPVEALDQHGVVSRLVPEWSAVRNKPQRNAYHRFTVDRHLLEAAANAAALVERVERPELLLIGALLHDIGKGFPGDHTEVGIEVVGAMGRRMGFSPQDVETLVTLCRFHLLLPDVATRRDLDDPTTIERVAEAVGDVGTLHLLAALTEADSLATGPSAWGAWKAGLVAELVRRTEERLAGRALEPTGGGRLLEDHAGLLDEVRRKGQAVIRLVPPRVVVVAPDRPGLLADVTGTLALHGLDVRSADAASEDGVATEVFTVEVVRGSWPDSARLNADLEAVLDHRLVLSDQLAAKAQAYEAARRPTAAYPVVPEVRVDPDASETSTVVEVRAVDELGLLHRVTRSLCDAGLDVVSARVSTVGDAVVDAFYVRSAAGGKVTSPDELAAMEAGLRKAIT